MQEFLIYYRGQCINQVNATSSVAALQKHYLNFHKGEKGQEVAVESNSLQAALEYARQLSMLPEQPDSALGDAT